MQKVRKWLQTWVQTVRTFCKVWNWLIPRWASHGSPVPECANWPNVKKIRYTWSLPWQHRQRMQASEQVVYQMLSEETETRCGLEVVRRDPYGKKSHRIHLSWIQHLLPEILQQLLMVTCNHSGLISRSPAPAGTGIPPHYSFLLWLQDVCTCSFCLSSSPQDSMSHSLIPLASVQLPPFNSLSVSAILYPVFHFSIVLSTICIPHILHEFIVKQTPQK